MRAKSAGRLGIGEALPVAESLVEQLRKVHGGEAGGICGGACGGERRRWGMWI